MRKPGSVKSLEALGRVRLSKNFFLRDFLYSEVANFYGVPNIPDDPDLAIEAGSQLCTHLIEPLQATFGRITIRSGFRSCKVNQLCNEKGHNCATNDKNYAHHIWDRRDANGHMGATACIVVNSYIQHYEKTGNWQALAWWIHDHLPYSDLYFFPKLCAFNITWHEQPRRRIDSYITPKGTLTKPSMANHEGDHSDLYPDFHSEIFAHSRQY
ncbi:MAG: hypothetical protein AAGD09_12535 [Cyanobacteria bacterium P01_F01_bin.56]